MRILLIAYEFPPSRSPQSLRWTYLTRELQRLGHDVHVLTIELGGHAEHMPLLPSSVYVYRTPAGPIRGVVALYRNWRLARLDVAGSHAAPDPAGFDVTGAGKSRGGWKHWVSKTLQKSAEFIIFPDLRGEWKRNGLRCLSRILDRVDPDIVISSHEPATTLELGIAAKRRGYRWVADLGDPVLAPYTAARWKKRAFALEAATCRKADHILVTSATTVDLLKSRHDVRTDCTVVTQGHDHHPAARDERARTTSNRDRLEMLYTGSFYSFRDPTALLRAVANAPGVRLSIASVSIPKSVLLLAAQHPQSLRLLGFLPHADALRWQQKSDVLVNIANSNVHQIPGKFYEYLGVGRPILHLQADSPDEAGEIVREHGLGWVVRQDDASLDQAISDLASRFQRGRLEDGLRIESFVRSQYSWKSLGRRVSDVLEQVAARPRTNGSSVG